MKKIFLSIALILTVVISFGQAVIDEVKDEMTDKVTYSTDGLVCSSKEKGFGIHPNIKEKKGIKIVRDLIVQMAGLGGCNKDNTMIILFANGTKMSLLSWNDFNCKNVCYFELSESKIAILSVEPISKIRLTNGESFKNYTHQVQESDYFIQLFAALK